METNVNYTLVGAFVIALCAAIVLSIIWLSSGFSLEQYSTYEVDMQESVTGLTIDSPVEYNGVNVGTVTSIKLNPKNPQQVELLLSIDSATPITRGTTATLTSRGITGITYIALKDKSTDLRPLLAEKGQPYPIIKAAPSLFIRIDTALSKIAESFESLFGAENQESIKVTLQNLNQLTTVLVGNTKQLNAILNNTVKASQQFTPFIQSSTSAMRVLETQTLPATYRLLSNLDEISRTLTEVTAEIKQNPSILVRGSAPAALGPGEGRVRGQ